MVLIILGTNTPRNIVRSALKCKTDLRGLSRRSHATSNVPSSASSVAFKKNKWIRPSDTNPCVISSVLDIEPTSSVTIPEFLRSNLHKWENAPAFECAVTGRTYTHGQVHRKSQSFAAALKQHGLGRREAVCILLPNIPEYPIVALGIWDAGLVVSPINPAYTVAEIGKQVADCGGKVMVTIAQLLPAVEKVLEGSPTLKSVVVVGEAGGHHSFFDMLNTDVSSATFLRGSDINTLRETAVLPYSSGTTGTPKGVELTHSTYTTNLMQITHPGYRLTQFFDGGSPQERLFALPPFFHIYGLQVILGSTLHQGGHTLCFPSFEPASFIKGIKQHRPTVLHLVTPLISFLCQSPEITPDDLKHTRGTVAGAAPIGKTLIERFITKFDQYMFFQEGFGMTELGVSHLIPPEMKNSRAGSCGILVTGTTSKIVDNELGRVVGPHHPGEICVRGPQAMKGYFQNEKATLDTIDSEGFIKTGDIGYYDEEGFLYIVDRLKELIKVKGLQVAPAELENVLRQHPDIADVAVIGVPHERWGEVPRAYVVPKSKRLRESSVNSFLKDKVAEHKRLVGGVEFIDVIPKAASGKILRRVLKSRFE
ncbi:probable 4-coumarate--CoA ligase 3 [Folsomia candida]|uniref:probable 4-coumarate--CoA ligase 3 n=1 Tax=Folsomia candida TaxID=158441 RepID=UPI000B8F0AE5|nr:probable 4-coumarate--CoA ligase 3 [Folsomia candida]XP_021962745.1 probable 4-coumarate--CoA ligase 3 [Folsomia candida]